MGVQDIVRWLLPREDRFFDLIVQQGGALRRATEALAEFGPGAKPADVAKKVQEIEHEGDKLLHQVEDALAETFVTPIDREDIHVLAGKLDDIIDRTNLTARSINLFDIAEPSSAMSSLMELLKKSGGEVEKALVSLRSGKFTELPDAAKRLKALEKEGDTVFRDAIGQLFRDPAIGGKELLKQKEVLEDLEDALDICEDVGEFLAEIAVKHALGAAPWSSRSSSWSS